MSNELSAIFSSIEASAPGIEWAAFYLSGGSDDFSGFRELTVCIDGEAERRGGAKDNVYDVPVGTALEEIVNSHENQQAILDAIIPAGQSLNCAGPGACGGIFLIITKKHVQPETVTISLDWRNYAHSDVKWTFRVPAGFRGMMTQYENIEDESRESRIN